MGKKGRYYVKEEYTNYEVKRRVTKLISNLFGVGSLFFVLEFFGSTTWRAFLGHEGYFFGVSHNFL
jgi:hypothetical protein